MQRWCLLRTAFFPMFFIYWANTQVAILALMQNINRRVSVSLFLFRNRHRTRIPVVYRHHSPMNLHMIQPSKKSFNSKGREMEIRRQIQQLKQQGRIRPKADELEDNDNDDDNSMYVDKIRQKMGPIKSKLLGYDATLRDDDEEEDEGFEPEFLKKRMGQIGKLSQIMNDSEDSPEIRVKKGDQEEFGAEQFQLYEDDGEYSREEEPSEDELLELVEQRLREKLSAPKEVPYNGARTIYPSGQQQENPSSSNIHDKTTSTRSMSTAKSKLTSGIGGTWDEGQTNDAVQDMYQPKTGSWGAFPRPRDISKAYGGGRRVGAGYTDSVTSVDETRERLQRYRQTMGIEVESEKINASEIDDALKIAAYAMQRGVYSQAVSSLEKVTKFCSTNSKVGGKVFLELAMAYEAAGQTDEAITVYTTLTRSRTEEISTNAKRLLYGIEAIKFMQENVGSAEFSRKQAKMTFIDTTGLANFASNFDDVYETAYVNLDRSFYKELTESVVRSSREARQILLRATRPGEVGRLRIVQALRSLSRYFEDALENEIQMSRPLPEPIAVMDGKPIVPQRQPSSDVSISSSIRQMDQYVLMSSEQMLENLMGEWQLQLIADKRGDGVKFFNSTLAWQFVDTNQILFLDPYAHKGF